MRRDTEIILEATAARERWPLPFELREKLIARLAFDALFSPSSRVRMAAAKALVAMDAVNIAWERLAFDKLKWADVEELKRRLKALEGDGGNPGQPGEADSPAGAGEAPAGQHDAAPGPDPLPPLPG